MRILFIEDDNNKILDVKQYLEEIIEKLKVDVVHSYHSGIKALTTKEYNLLLLDMSIPTREDSGNSLNVHFEKFGGYLVLKEMQRKKVMLPTILITMFDYFGDSDNSIKLDELDNELRVRFSTNYKGAVFYSANSENWKTDLLKFINPLLKL